MRALVVLVVMASTAQAETAEGLTETARNNARDGRCNELPAIGRRVHELDDHYYTFVYSLDPVIAGCTDKPVADPRFSPKSPEVALGLSLGLTAGGLGLMIAGGSVGSAPLGIAGGAIFFIGPTTGHIYAGDPANAGLGVRTVGALAAVVGASLFLQCIDECHGQDHREVGAVMFIGGGVLYTGGVIYEIGAAPEAAHRYNREHGFEATVVPTGNGLALVGRF